MPFSVGKMTTIMEVLPRVCAAEKGSRGETPCGAVGQSPAVF